MDGEISPDELQRELDEKDTVIVDIRSPAAYREGHIPGSRNIPFGDLPGEVESLTDAEHVVTVCPHGKASLQAARVIGSYEGIDDARVDSMAGGLAEWPGELATDDDHDAKSDRGAESTTASASDAGDAPF